MFLESAGLVSLLFVLYVPVGQQGRISWRPDDATGVLKIKPPPSKKIRNRILRKVDKNKRSEKIQILENAEK